MEMPATTAFNADPSTSSVLDQTVARQRHHVSQASGQINIVNVSSDHRRKLAGDIIRSADSERSGTSTLLFLERYFTVDRCRFQSCAPLASTVVYLDSREHPFIEDRCDLVCQLVVGSCGLRELVESG